MPELDPNWLQTFIKRPPSLITLVVVVFFGTVWYANVSSSLTESTHERAILSTRVDALETRSDDIGKRTDALSYRVTEIEKNSDGFGSEFHTYIRDQSATTVTVFKELSEIKASLATISANLTWLKHEVPPDGHVPFDK